MSFKKLSSEMTVEVGQNKSSLTFKPLGAEALSAIMEHIDLDNIHATKPSSVVDVMVRHIVKLEGIDEDITSAFMLNEFPMLDFWACLMAMVDAAVITEDQGKNSGSPSE